MRLSSLAFVLSAAVCLASLVGCSSDDEKPAFNSREALRRAPSLEYGCAYTEHTASSYGTASSEEDTPRCREDVRCDELDAPSSGYAFAAGAEYNSSSYNTDLTNFIGTCEEHQAVNSGDSEARSACHTAPKLCLADPNCLALRDCVLTCGDGDEACTKTCLENADYRASDNLVASASCVEENEDNPDLRALFAPASASR